MAETRAVLLDVFDTVLKVDFDTAFGELVKASGLDQDHWIAGLQANRRPIMTGEISPEEAFKSIFERAQKPTRDVSALVRRDVELLQVHASVYPDVLPFLDELRSRDLRLAFVSNCAPNAGPLLDELGLADKVDEVVLSCDVGSAKPDPAIYLKAIDMLGVDAADAIFVDDQPSYVSGAEALGIRSVLIDRRGRTPGAVQSLDQVMELV